MNLVQQHFVSSQSNGLRPETLLFVQNSNQTIPSVIDALNVCFGALIDSELWNKIHCFYPNAGATQFNHAFNAKAPFNNDASFRKVYYGDIFSDVNGDLGNGNGYANSFFIPAYNQTLLNNGITVCVGTQNTPLSNQVYELGIYDSATSSSLFSSKYASNNEISVIQLNGNALTFDFGGNTKGLYTLNRENAVQSIYKNKSFITSGFANGTLTAYPIYIHVINLYNAGVLGYSNQRIQSTLFHSNLSNTEILQLQTIIDTFENSLGRKTW